MTTITRSSFLAAFLGSMVLASASAVAQGELASVEEARVPVVLAGFVLQPDGSPAEGAVVVSSAGGQAVTDARGAYRLETRVPAEVERVQVTAVGRAGQNRVGSTSVGVSATPGNVAVDPIALLKGGSCSPSWLPTFGAEPGADSTVNALAVFDDGSGPALYAGGGLTSVAGSPASRIAKWDGAGWSALASGVDGSFGSINALAVFDDGGGPALYAGGDFSSVGGTSANNIAKWDGTSWSALLGGVNNDVEALAVYDAGAGPALYVGGSFTGADGFSRSRIASWDGTSWSGLGSGVNDTVQALAVHDDGGGPALFVGGSFTSAGGASASRIARWDGTSWSALGSGASSIVNALAVHDDGGGAALYAGGSFSSAGGISASRIARWDGASWSALGSGIGVGGSVFSFASFDDGTGPALHAAGSFTSAGGISAESIARWDGASWSALGSGMSELVQALEAYEVDGVPALFAGGVFNVVPDSGDSYLARWGCLDTTAPDLACPLAVTVLDRFWNGMGGEVVSFTVTGTDDYDPAPSVVCTPPSESFFPLGTTLVTCTATDASGNESTCQFPVTVERKARRR